MAAMSETGQKIPLGVGTILGDSFSILFGNFFKVLALVSAATIADVVLSEFVFSQSVYRSAMWFQLLRTELGWYVATLSRYIVDPLVYGLMIGLVMRLVYAAKCGRPQSFGLDVKLALPAIIPVFASFLVTRMLAPVNLLAAWISAVWIYAVFFTIASVAVLERFGWRFIVRSVVLTSGYRLPILGLFVVMVIVLVLLSYTAHFAWVAATLALPQWYDTGLAWTVSNSLAIGLGYAFGGAVSALIYARLREIKEDVDVDQTEAVFD